ncbi:carbohydrate-binding module family 35 protein [Apiospora marii]|uniref:carbohydrate-binding module family 35 protein n=1 Tax=Apiospora marii TaxID=335849 RepID=UPI0031319CE9
MSAKATSELSSIPLRGWTFKQGHRLSNEGWLEAGDPPTEIHRDLVRSGKAPEYRQDFNELAVRWIGDETWTYRTTFNRPELGQDEGQEQGQGIKTVLNFQGLDTFASVYLNDELILASDNMFIQHRVHVTLRPENTLEIVFESARLKGLELVKQHPEHRFIVHQTEISRGPVRKAQYHWGWDWGPIIMSCGPTKPITLETYVCRLEGLRVMYELSADLKRVHGTVQVQAEGVGDCELYVEIVNNQTGEVELSTTSISQTTGFRRVDLVQEPDAHGRSFYFRLNHVDVFAGGSCWIPLDNELSRHPDNATSYRDWIRRAAEGNQTMVRVWGGGVYEPDAFYAAADALGVLVWQDFMFACASYPAADPAYLASVEREARQNVRRLRYHPSLVVWAGNNEDYQLVERYGLQYDPDDDEDPQSWLKTDFPARYIYEHLLPQVIATETAGTPYHPSSPFGNGKSTVLKVDPTIGDIHQWNVWHGTMQPYQQLPDMGGRFVSEFGMEAYPHLETLEKCITRQEDRYPGSMAMDFRNKAIGHERRLVSYVSENFRLRRDWEGFAHLSQVMQADAVGCAYRAWRRQWGTREGGRRCGGVLVWQLNDCWPTVSWAVVDYYGVPKPAYYAIKRAMRPVVVGAQRRFRDWTMRPADELWQRDTSHIDMRALWEDDVRYDVWVASNGQQKGDKGAMRLTVKFVSVKTGEEVVEAIVKEVPTRLGNGTAEILHDARVETPAKQDSRAPFNPANADPFVIHATLHDANDQLVSSDCSWPDPIKYLGFADRGVRVSYPDKSTAVVTVKKPVKGFVFSEVAQVAPLSDNGFDIMPGETWEVTTASDYPIDQLKWRYVEMDD